MFRKMKKLTAALAMLSSSAFCVTDITEAEIEKQVQTTAAMYKTYKIKCKGGAIVLCSLAKAEDVHIEPRSSLPWIVEYFAYTQYNPAVYKYCAVDHLGRHVTHDQYLAIIKLLTEEAPHQCTGEELERKLRDMITR